MTDPYAVLVVDDIPDWQITMGGILRDHGYTVSTAGSLDESIALLAENRFDLALLDLRLDETDEDNQDGLKLAKFIRERWPDMKIIVITGYGTRDVVGEALAPDNANHHLVDDFLEKNNTDQLIDVVKRVLKK